MHCEIIQYTSVFSQNYVFTEHVQSNTAPNIKTLNGYYCHLEILNLSLKRLTKSFSIPTVNQEFNIVNMSVITITDPAMTNEHANKLNMFRYSRNVIQMND